MALLQSSGAAGLSRPHRFSSMKTNIGLNDEARLEVGQILNLLPADGPAAEPGIDLPGDHMLSELLALHEEMIVQLRCRQHRLQEALWGRGHRRLPDGTDGKAREDGLDNQVPA